MKIHKIESQSRRDFYAIYQCEGCEHTHRASGYDDTNFHQNVVPKMICEECGKCSGDFGEDAARPLAPLHADHVVI